MATATTRHVQITIGLTNQVGGPAARVTHSLWQMVRAAKATLFAFHAIGKTVGYFVRINQQMEDLNLAFAGVIKAKGLADSFASSMNLAKGFVQEIRNQAGLLPGSLNQYVEIAKQSYSKLSEAGFATVQEQAKFIGQYGAVALTLQVPAAQAGRDLMHMLTGNVRTTTRTWALLKKEIGQTVVGWEKMTTKEQNAAWMKLGVEGRRNALQQALNQYSDMVKFAANTWDAAWGAFGTHMQDVALAFSEDYFKGLKSALQSINATLASNKEFVASLLATTIKLTGALLGLRALRNHATASTGRSFGELLGMNVVGTNPFAGFKAGTKLKEVLVRELLQGPNVRYGSGARRTPLMLGAGGQHMGIVPYTPDVNWRFPSDKTNPGTAWVWGNSGQPARYGRNAVGRAAFGHRADSGTGVYSNLVKQMIPVPLTYLERLKAGLPGFNVAIGGLLALPAAFAGVLLLVKGIEALTSNAKLNATDQFGITEYLADLWFRIGSHLMEIGIELDQVFAMALPLALAGILDLVLTFSRVVSYLAKTTADLWMRLTSKNYTGYSKFEIWDSVLADEARAREEKKDGLLNRKGSVDATTAARGGGNVIFKDAKFTITQQFAEGFDPDRIAVAFADDLSALANRRLQSSFSPVGGM